ncbi:MAG: TonB family protein [Gammaproteobacteria bacterium]|nr:TonB family protein [Gammaproteobacteria bacterium]
MNCEEITRILDEHAVARLAPARKAEVDTHLEGCSRCSSVWHAQQVLQNRPVPPVPPGLLAETRRLAEAESGRSAGFSADASEAGGASPSAAESAPHGGGARSSGRARRSAAVGGRVASRFTWRAVTLTGVMAAGAALAAVGIVSQMERNGQAAPSRADAAVSPAGGASEGVSAPAGVPAAPAPRAERDSGAPRPAAAGLDGAAPQADERPGSLPDGDYFALLKVPPVYPPEAAGQGLEGSVVVEFTVTDTGDVADPAVVESTDAVFERAALDAVRQFKYMPRIAGGEAVAVPGVRNRITFVLETPAPPAPRGSEHRAMTGAPDPSMRPSFWDILAPALACASSGDLLCAELVLDEAAATYEFNAAEERAVWKFYGFIYARLADYERSIAAYERAASVPGAWRGDTTLLTIAHLYMKRHQYVPALERVEEYIENAETTGPASPGAYQFAARLRQLGAAVQ